MVTNGEAASGDEPRSDIIKLYRPCAFMTDSITA